MVTTNDDTALYVLFVCLFSCFCCGCNHVFCLCRSNRCPLCHNSCLLLVTAEGVTMTVIRTLSAYLRGFRFTLQRSRSQPSCMSTAYVCFVSMNVTIGLQPTRVGSPLSSLLTNQVGKFLRTCWDPNYVYNWFGLKQF